MLKIAPSILASDFSRLGEECRDVLDAGADWLHIDVMDGVFVPNLTLGPSVLNSLSNAVDAFYDVHLMLEHPLSYVKAFAAAGAHMITIHVEAQSDPLETIAAIRACGVKAGITLRPRTPAAAVFPYLEHVDMVLVMTVEPGFGGQAFMPEMCEKIASIAAQAQAEGYTNMLIEVDGGIDAATAPLAVAAGANVLVAGQAVFGSRDRKKAIDAIRQSVAQ